MYIVGGGVEERPKLCVLKELVSGGFEANCVGVRRKKIRRILTKLRGYSRAEGGRGRWRGLKREERKCTECDSGEVEDVKHFLLRCKAWNGEWDNNNSSCCVLLIQLT